LINGSSIGCARRATTPFTCVNRGCNAADADIFAKAIAENRIVLTFDLDFGEILALAGAAVTSVVLFRLNNTRTPFVQMRLEAVLAADGTALEQGAIIIVEDGRHRLRNLPIVTDQDP
jgi:predicted nuclease of predicted toxin-antitoxin system